MRKYIPLVLFIFSWPVLSADIHGWVVRVLDGDTIEVMGVSLDIENYCTLRLLFNQSLVLDKVPEYGKPAKCCSP